MNRLKMDWPSEVTLEFLKLYENEEIIWNSKCQEHKNRKLVNDAWERIRQKLSVKCSVKLLKKKKESLMATYRPLLKKFKESRAGGSGREPYKPTWFAFEPMASFLHGIYQPVKSKLRRSSEESFYIKSTSLHPQEREKEENTPPVRRKTIIRRSEETEDEAEIAAKYWAIKYRKLSSDQKLVAMEIIDDVLLKGMRGQLTDEYIISNY